MKQFHFPFPLCGINYHNLRKMKIKIKTALKIFKLKNFFLTTTKYISPERKDYTRQNE